MSVIRSSACSHSRDDSSAVLLLLLMMLMMVQPQPGQILRCRLPPAHWSEMGGRRARRGGPSAWGRRYIPSPSVTFRSTLLLGATGKAEGRAAVVGVARCAADDEANSEAGRRTDRRGEEGGGAQDGDRPAMRGVPRQFPGAPRWWAVRVVGSGHDEGA